jgi:hypothetical protein
MFDASKNLGPVFALLLGSSVCALTVLTVVAARARRGTSNA